MCLCVCAGRGALERLSPRVRRPPAPARCEHRRLQAGGERPEGAARAGAGGALPAGPRAASAAAQRAHLHFLNEPLDGRRRRQPPAPLQLWPPRSRAAPAEPGMGRRRPRGAAPGAARGTLRPAKGEGPGWGAVRAWRGLRRAPRVRAAAAQGAPSRGALRHPPLPAPPPPAALPGVCDRSELLAINNNKPNLHLPLALRKQLIMH